jgi:hypothetical protein
MAVKFCINDRNLRHGRQNDKFYSNLLKAMNAKIKCLKLFTTVNYDSIKVCYPYDCNLQT